jgi:hypothetical protein
MQQQSADACWGAWAVHRGSCTGGWHRNKPSQRRGPSTTQGSACFDQSESTSNGIDHALTITGLGFVEEKLKIFMRGPACWEGGGIEEDVCAASRIDEPAVKVVAGAALKFDLYVIESA